MTGPKNSHLVEITIGNSQWRGHDKPGKAKFVLELPLTAIFNDTMSRTKCGVIENGQPVSHKV